jgi:MFS transporter, Spinster family, sphingosine-1-phosphate transporter
MESPLRNDAERTESDPSCKRRKEIRPGIKVATVLVLCLVNLTYYMDRFSIAGILIDIQDAFDVGDAEGGALQSAFILSYVIFAPLTGYLGDR